MDNLERAAKVCDAEAYRLRDNRDMEYAAESCADLIRALKPSRVEEAREKFYEAEIERHAANKSLREPAESAEHRRKQKRATEARIKADAAYDELVALDGAPGPIPELRVAVDDARLVELAEAAPSWIWKLAHGAIMDLSIVPGSQRNVGVVVEAMTSAYEAGTRAAKAAEAQAVGLE